MEFIVRDFTLEDAAGVARMWNESNDGWPGGFTGNQPYTAERVLEREGKSKFVALLLAVTPDRVVGYCSILAVPNQQERAYVCLLNCVPDCHGKGVGKALLREAVRRATDAGYRCLYLHTWAGNMKAVPLYKKTGFFWQPDTSVNMENYLPQILRHPFMSEFLDGEDWYTVFKRELNVAEDRIDWNGIKVYPYEFESKKGRISFVADRESNGITAIETPDFYAACLVGSDEFAAGVEHPIRWIIRNKRGGKIPVTLFAEGEKGVGLSLQENFMVEDELIVERTFRPSTDAIKPPDADRRAHVVHTTLVIDGKAVSLDSGVILYDPIIVQEFLRLPVLRPGVTTVGETCFRSRVDADLDCDLHFGPTAGIEMTMIDQSGPIRLSPKGWSGSRFAITPEVSGGFEVPVQIRFQHQGQLVESKSTKFKLLALKPGGVEGMITSTGAYLINESVRIWVPFKGNGMSVFSADGSVYYSYLTKGAVGVPFNDWDFQQTRFDLRLERKEGEITLHYSAPSNSFPGILLEGSITLTSGPLIEVKTRVMNQSASASQIQVHQGGSVACWGQKGHQLDWITVPLKEGIIRECVWQDPTFPGVDDLPKEPSEYSESWCCYEGKEFSIGAIWQDAQKLDFNWFSLPLITSPEIEVAAGGCVELTPVKILINPGNWEKVRQFWASNAGMTLPESTRTRSILELDSKSSPVIITESHTSAQIQLESYRGKNCSGTLKLQTPDGVRVDRSEWTIETLKRGSAFIQPVELSVAELSPRAVNGVLSHSDVVRDQNIDLPIWVAGDRSQSVEIKEIGEGDFELYTGWMNAKVSAKHRGVLYALERNGQNHLATSYPNPKEFLWMNPWFGGSHIIAQGPPNLLNKTKFQWEKIERTGKAGLIWQGIRAMGDPENKDYRWLRIETDYLTLPGSNVIAVIGRVVNKTAAYARSGFEIFTFPNPAGQRQKSISWYQEQGKLCSIRRDEFGEGHQSESWVADSSPDNTACVSVIKGPGMRGVGLHDCGKEITLLATGADFAIQPFSSTEGITFIVLTDTVEEAIPYKMLADLVDLP